MKFFIIPANKSEFKNPVIGSPLRFKLVLAGVSRESGEKNQSQIIYNPETGQGAGNYWKLTTIGNPVSIQKDGLSQMIWEIQAAPLKLGSIPFPKISLNHNGVKVITSNKDTVSVSKHFDNMSLEFLNNYPNLTGTTYAPEKVSFQSGYFIQNAGLVLLFLVIFIFIIYKLKSTFKVDHPEPIIKKPRDAWLEAEIEIRNIEHDWSHGKLSLKNGTFNLSKLVKDLLSIKLSIPVSEFTSEEIIHLSKSLNVENKTDLELKGKINEFIRHTDPVKYMKDSEQNETWKVTSLKYAWEILELSKPAIGAENETNTNEI